MHQQPMAMNKKNMIGATERAKDRVKGWIDLAKDVTTDTRKTERLQHHECRGCFYASQTAGTAITTRPA